MSDLINIVATVMRASSHRFVGRLGRDPEIRYLESGKCVANGRIAINRPGAKQGDGQEPDWFKVDVWNEQAQAFADACHKGDLVEVIGRVRTNRWTDRTTGEEKLDLVVTADHWSLVQSRAVQSGGAALPAQQQSAPAPVHPAYAAAGHQPQAQADDIPF